MPTGFNKTDQSSVFKDIYLGPSRETLNNKIFMLAQIEQNEEDVEGNEAVLNIHLGRNEGVGARQELATLPTAGRQTYARKRVPVRSNYARIQVSGQAIRASGSDRGSFERSTSSEVRGAVKDLRNDVARQVWAAGTGSIAVVSGAISGATVSVANASDATMRQLRVGMVIDIGSVANPTLRGSGTIASVDREAKTFDLESTIAGTTTSDVIFRTGSGGDGTSQAELTGLQTQIAGSGELWGIDPADYEQWVSYADASAGAISEDLFVKAAMEVDLISGEELDLWVVAAVFRGLSNLITSTKRFPNTTELKAGYTGISVSAVGQGDGGPNTMTVAYDKDMVEDATAYGITRDRLQSYAMSDWDWMDEDGAVLNRVPNTDAYEATLYKDFEIATDNRAAHCKLSGITGLPT